MKAFLFFVVGVCVCVCSCAYVDETSKLADLYLYKHVLAYGQVDTFDGFFFASSSWPKGTGQLMPGYNRCSLIVEAEKLLSHSGKCSGTQQCTASHTHIELGYQTVWEAQMQKNENHSNKRTVAATAQRQPQKHSTDHRRKSTRTTRVEHEDNRRHNQSTSTPATKGQPLEWEKDKHGHKQRTTVQVHRYSPGVVPVQLRCSSSPTPGELTGTDPVQPGTAVLRTRYQPGAGFGTNRVHLLGRYRPGMAPVRPLYSNCTIGNSLDTAPVQHR